MPADIWRVGEILVQYPQTIDYNIPYVYNYGSQTNLQRPIQDRFFNGVRYARIQQGVNRDRIGTTLCAVHFRYNPGEQTVYYIGYVTPTELTSEAIPLSLPEHLHTYLYAATIALINGYQNGDILEAITFIEDEIKPKITKERNAGAQGRPGLVRRCEA